MKTIFGWILGFIFFAVVVTVSFCIFWEKPIGIGSDPDFRFLAESDTSQLSPWVGTPVPDRRLGRAWYTTKNVVYLIFFFFFGWVVIMFIPGFAFGKLERLAEALLLFLIPAGALVLQFHHGWSSMSPNLGLWILLLYSATLTVVMLFSQKKAWMALIWIVAAVCGLVWKLW